MRAGDVMGICHVDNINDGSHHVAQFGSSLGQRRREGGDCVHHLLVDIAVEAWRASCCPGDGHMVPDADSARVAVYVLEGIAG